MHPCQRQFVPISGRERRGRVILVNHDGRATTRFRTTMARRERGTDPMGCRTGVTSSAQKAPASGGGA